MPQWQLLMLHESGEGCFLACTFCVALQPLPKVPSAFWHVLLPRELGSGRREQPWHRLQALSAPTSRPWVNARKHVLIHKNPHRFVSLQAFRHSFFTSLHWNARHNALKTFDGIQRTPFH